MRGHALLLAIILGLGSAHASSPPGRRLLQRRLASQAPFNTAQRLGSAASPTTAEQRRRREASERVAQELAEQQSLDAALQTAANRTTQLLRRRAALLAQVARIDAEIAKERDSRRAAITRKYEEELKALDEEESHYARAPAPAGGESLREQIAAAVVAHQTSGRSRGGASGGSNGMAHQDIEHQDVDIDVILTHIDADGDGVITKAEAKSASTGAAVVQFGPSALVGCLAGVVCYVLCRFVAARYVRSAAASSRAQGGVAAWLQPRGAGKSPLAVAGAASKSKGSASNEVVSSHDKAARMRKRHGECAIAC
jgi:hypothetical protein